MELTEQTNDAGRQDIEVGWELNDEELDRTFGPFRACVTVSTGEFTKR